ncbi:MAG: hypothetical protein ACLR7Z_13090 [Bilophila wadsworthia]
MPFLAVGAAPALAKNFTELGRGIAAGGAWYVGMGAMGKAISTMYPELDVSLFPGGGLVTSCTSRRARATSASPRTASSSRRPRGIDPYKKPTENVMGLLNLHDSTRMHFIVNKASRHYVPRPDQGKEDAHPHLHVPHRRKLLSVRQVDP